MKFATTHTTNSLTAYLAYRFHFNGHEKDDEVVGVGGWYVFGDYGYDARLGRRPSLDPVTKPSISNYVCFGNNPVLFIDPDGLDWFKDQDGNVQWHDNTSEGFSDMNKNSWTNIGTELIEFNGNKLTYSWQTTDEQGMLHVNSISFHAVSGRPQEDANGNQVFDYSSERQKEKGIGGLPEGLYSLNKSDLQLISDVPLWNRFYGSTGLGGQFKGGEYAWGRQRWWLTPEEGNTFGRSDFTIHGGASWGSAGCIDLGTIGMTDFTRAIMGRLGEKVYLKVDYTIPALKLKSLDTETWTPTAQ